MVGDIDFLFKAKQTVELEEFFKSNKYKKNKYSFFENRHLTRR